MADHQEMYNHQRYRKVKHCLALQPESVGLWLAVCQLLNMANLSRRFAFISATTCSILLSRIRGAGLLVASLCRQAPALSPSNSRKLVGKLRETFGLKIEHVLCASVRGCSAVFQSETNAPAMRVLRATARWSIRDWGLFLPLYPDYAPVFPSIIKALEASGGGCSKIERGKPGCLRRSLA